jgi:DNA-binding response OmpR family regulator
MPRIAVIDDEPDLLHLVEEVFDERGWETLIFPDGAEALDTLVDDPPDLILLDLWLGGAISGWDILQYLHAQHPTQEIPVIIWSAAERDLRGNEERLREQGIPVLPKPCEIDELYAAVDAALSSKQPTLYQRV